MGNSPECLVAAHGILRALFVLHLYRESNKLQKGIGMENSRKEKSSPRRDLNPQSFPPEGNALSLGHTDCFFFPPSCI